jgi:hypothetical protein
MYSRPITCRSIEISYADLPASMGRLVVALRHTDYADSLIYFGRNYHVVRARG